MSQKSPSVADHLVQAGRPAQIDGRHVNLPIELGSTIVFDTLAAFEAARDARYEPGTMYYGRYGNEAVYKLESMLADLEGAHGVTLTSSGVAAITLPLLTFARPGRHLLVADHVYGNTRMFCETVLRDMDVEVEYYDPMIGGQMNVLIRETTCAIMFEAPGSGTFEVPDIPSITAVARARGVPTILDNTWATPLFCRPLDLGVDISVASGSKYLSGHSDCMLGTIACTQDHFAAVRKTVMAVGDKTGGQEIFLMLRGLRTLKLRMAAVDAAGREMAAWFADQPQVKRVLHPALASCPGHEHWKRDFSGAAGLFGVVFHPCEDEQIRAFVDALHHFGIGVSWGGYESLVLPVDPVRSAGIWAEDGQLVRFNIGLEDTQSLKDDLAAALPLLNTSRPETSMPTNKIDHFAIGADTLDQGVTGMRDALGVDVPRGGKHDAMSTHNCVMQAGNESFFELIAIDPDAPAPGRTRWFTLDDPATQARLATRPRALCWVVNTDDLDGIIAASPVDLGEVVDFARGDRTWRLTVPTDGSLPIGGLLPAFIEWSPGPHPSTGQQDLGVTLKRVHLRHPEPAALFATLKALGVDHLADVHDGPAALSFELDTPNGTVTLD